MEKAETGNEGVASKTEIEGAVEVRDNLEPKNEGVTYEPLFGAEAVTEAQLRGEDEPATGENKADPEPTGETDLTKKAKPEVKADAEAKADDKKADIQDVTGEIAKKDEHIAGLTTAVSVERQTVKKLKAENQRLSAENETLKQPKDSVDKEAEKFKDFKVLSDEDYDALVDEDPDAAQKYLYKFNRYQEYQGRIKNRKVTESRAQLAEKEIVNFGIQEMEKVLPGITQGKNELVPKLTEFAVNHGIDDAVLAVLTDPRTKVMTPQGENLIIGDGAAQLVRFIKETYDKTSNIPDRAKIEAELRPQIEAEVYKKVMDKLKKDPSMGFRSLDQLAGSGEKDAKETNIGPITVSDYAKYSEAEREALLGG